MSSLAGGNEKQQRKDIVTTLLTQDNLPKITEPYFFYPVALVTAIIILWTTTLNLIETNDLTTHEGAINSATEFAHTYEAQVVRAIREIDQSLNVVKRGYELGNNKTILALVDDWGLLLPDFLFVTSVTDADGNVINSTRAFEKINIADRSYFREQLKFDQLSSSQPWQDPHTKEWKLTFSRRINTPTGAFAGIVFTSVDASYFVSGYEVTPLGQHGVGLSEEEQLQADTQLKRQYLQRAGAISFVLIVVAIILSRLSWQLKKSRSDAMEEHIAHAKKIKYLAYHDGLTDLPNRSFFSRLLNHGIAEAKRYDRRLALLFLDLDRFKIINDTLGHDVGDKLLIEVAKRLKESLRETDTVARLGDDEFVVLLPEMNDEKQLSAVARKILSAVDKLFHLAGQDLRVTVSIGISVFPIDGEDEQALVKNADIAMYHAKEGGENNFCFYSEELSADSLERLALESSMPWFWIATSSVCSIRRSMIYTPMKSLVPKPCYAGNTPASVLFSLYNFYH